MTQLELLQAQLNILNAQKVIQQNNYNIQISRIDKGITDIQSQIDAINNPS